MYTQESLCMKLRESVATLLAWGAERPGNIIISLVIAQPCHSLKNLEMWA